MKVSKLIGLVAATMVASSIAVSAAGAQAGAQTAAPKMEKHDMGAMQGSGHKASGWKELDAFHHIMEEAWHPVAKGEFKPAREHAAALLAAGEVWRKSKGPAHCDTEAARAGFAKFISDAKSYADAAKRSASDDAIKVTLKATHDSFEAIAEPCMMAGMKHEMKKP